MLTPEQAVDSINERFGRHPGYRALHAKGTVCAGRFTATPGAAALTRAPHMRGDPVDATIRFSNASGDPESRDFDLDIRGMATKFHVPGGPEHDIVAQTSRRFPTRTPDGFVRLVRANDPGVSRLWRLPAFLATHREALPGLREATRSLRPPTSYASCAYYAIHAFRWVDSDGRDRFVRYTWRPASEEARLSPREARTRGADYLQHDLAARLERAPIAFTLELQLAAEGDPVDDPVAVWPADRETVVAGTLEITALAPDRESAGSVLVFDPVHVTDGIELSDDPILRFRPRAYSVSIERRTSSTERPSPDA